MSTIKDYKKIALVFRKAFEETDFTNFSDKLCHFPKHSCVIASIVLGYYFYKNHIGNFFLKKAAKMQNQLIWHSWLTYGNIIIDITADQFLEIENPVIVTTHSVWHEKFKERIIIKLINERIMERIYFKIYYKIIKRIKL